MKKENPLKRQLDIADRELKWEREALMREQRKTALVKEYLVTLAAFAGGLINPLDAVAYKRAVEVINELQRQGKAV
jgi:hypothetical protein